MERAKGFEPSTPTLARLCSTPELRPRCNRIGHVHPARMIIGRGNFARLASQGYRAGGLPAGTPIGIVTTMPAVPLVPEQLFRHLDGLDITHQTVSHPPVFAVAETAAVRGQLPGGHRKSLFQRQKGRLLARYHARRAPQRSQQAGHPPCGAAVFVWRRRQPRHAIGRAAGQRDALRPLSTMPRSGSSRCSIARCSNTTRSTTTRWRTTVPPRSHRLIYCVLSPLAGTSPASSIWRATNGSGGRLYTSKKPVVFGGRIN